MNRRISLQDIATRLREQVSDSLGVAKIGTALDADYLSSIAASEFPAVWVGAQRSTPTTDGRGFTHRVSQDVVVELVVRLIVSRAIAGEFEEEDKLNRIADAAADALMGWTPTDAAVPITWVQSIDGPAEESVMTVDLLFRTQVRYQYAAAGA